MVVQYDVYTQGEILHSYVNYGFGKNCINMNKSISVWKSLKEEPRLR